MKTLILHSFFLLAASVLSVSIFAQNVVITGNIKNSQTGDVVPAVSITVKGSRAGTFTDDKGNFKLTAGQQLPVTLVVSSIGFNAQDVAVSTSGTALQVSLEPASTLGAEVVVSASRVPESILRSPVSIEKLDARSIRASPAPSFYDALANMKGVELSTQSLTFKSVNTRGFNSNGNTRMLQLIDGMDNQAPGLNFSIGNIVGITELDMDNVELIPGAASALYGPNALNGIVLLNSKSPFQYQGLSANIKSGILDEPGRTKASTGYYDVTLRYAKAFNNKFAFKINLGYIKADDWQAYDQRDQSLLNGTDLKTGNRTGNAAYNGVNTYGDETNVNMKSSLQPAALNAGNPLGDGIRQISDATGGAITPLQIYNAIMPASGNAFVSRTGYDERNLADYDTKNLKANLALHYKFAGNLEALAQGSYGTGTTVYTGADRYSIKNFRMGQYKVELRSDNFYIRGYTTQERARDSYAIGTLGLGINEAWKPSTQWFQQYFGTYAGGALTTFGTVFQQSLQGGQSAAQAFQAATDAAQGGSVAYHNAARTTADNGRLLPGTAEFDAAADGIKKKPIPGDANGVGARFADKTNLYQAEFMYNFKNEFSFIELIVGGNYRLYDLNSEGTIFAKDDKGEEFNVEEYGGYVQAAKQLFNDNLKLTGSLRYDKNKNFEGQFSPRLSAVYSFFKTHNIRVSYQTGFRIPTTQDQYIDLRTPQARLIGGLPLLRQRYGLETGPVYTLESVQAGSPQQYSFNEFKPEKVIAYEIGYKSLIGNKLMIDAYVYTNTFKNFNGSQVLVKPTSASTQDVFSVPVSYTQDIESWGWAVGVDYNLPAQFVAGGNVSYNELRNADELGNFQAMYNTPRLRTNVYIGNRNIARTNISFNATWRWQDEFIWSSSFVGPVVRALNLGEIPAYGALDVQVSKLFPKPKITLKIGGANVTRNRYVQSWGNPTVGAQWYASIGYNL
ncbi:MAG: TonB-dependent receptor [Chitinophagaceae bacterium]|nr:TonB-dependent receptor [Chitinophagaceae bacterium]